MKWAAATALSLGLLLPNIAEAQCVRMVGSNQIVCSSYPNSTPPVYSGPGFYTPGRGALGVGQMVYGAGAAALSARSGNQAALQYNAATIANGYYNYRNYPAFRYQPRIAYPAQRPSGYRW